MIWLNRITKQLVDGKSPADMAAIFGGVFVDASGNAQSNANWIFNPDLSAVVGFLPRYWVISGDTVSLMSEGERDAVDVALLSGARDAVAAQLDAVEEYSRAFALVVLDELNLHASRVTSILDAIDGAASLAALKTAVAAIPDVPQRTVANLKTGVRNKLGS
jgi:hypothetical protein